MGYAHGELLSDEANAMMDQVWEYLKDQVVSVKLHVD